MLESPAASTPTELAAQKPRALGILAGSGRLPVQVATAARAAGRSGFIVGLEGFAERRVLIGPVRRPSLLDLRPDADGIRILARIGRAAFAGDDGLLAAVIKVLGEEGFCIIGAQDVLQEALGPRGLLTRAAPDAQAMSDIARGVAVARALGRVDVGQGCIVQQGLVLAVEAAEGTDAMLARTAELRRDGPGGVLVKLVKPGQDRRADLPTIGPATIRGAAEAGLRGVAFEAGGTILAERVATVDEADAAGL